MTTQVPASVTVEGVTAAQLAGKVNNTDTFDAGSINILYE